MAGLFAATSASAQPYDTIPDFFGDDGQGACVLRENQGQILKPNGDPQGELAFYYEHTPLGIYLRAKSAVSFTLGAVHRDTSMADTLYRVDMGFAYGAERVPVSVAPPVGGLSNYYVDAIAKEGVKAFDKVVYRDVWDSVHVYFYHASTGPRMSFVVEPGGDPSDIVLKFTGQDSLHVDWQGALKIYLDDKWIKLDEAIAYQVDEENEVIPLSWTAGYEHTNGAAFVDFTFDGYDTTKALVLQIGYPALMLGGSAQRNLDWSTFVGGEGSEEYTCVELDQVGDPYVCGYTWSNYFPVAPGNQVFDPFLEAYPGYESAIMVKYKGDNKQIYWATYYGATDGRTQAHKLAPYKGILDNHHHVFVTGSTSAPSFLPFARTATIFDDAVAEPFWGGTSRVWTAAFTKEDGTRDWATTYGQSDGDDWGMHGLAIDVNLDGKLLVAGQLEGGNMTSGTPDPDWASPDPTAFMRPTGDGFFIHYDDDYDVLWSTAFLETSNSNQGYGKITDVQLTETTDGNLGVYLVGGSTWYEGSSTPLDVVPPPSGGYYQTEADDLGAVVALVDLKLYKVLYCTFWGDIATAYGVYESDDKTRLWVAGYRKDENGTTDQLPEPPGGIGPVIHSAAHQGATTNQWSDAFVIRFNPIDFSLTYGTLLGGVRDDIMLDVNGNGDQVFFTGETRSATGFAQDLNPELYYHTQYNYNDRRDAFILALKDAPRPVVLWRTAFAGSNSDRGWGLAATQEELYLVGATASQATDFPLWEFNTNTSDPGYLLDYYEPLNYGGASQFGMVPWQEFWHAMDIEHDGFGEAPLEVPHTPCDAFIASFGLPLGLATSAEELPEGMTNRGLACWTNDGGITWTIDLPSLEQWTIRLFDAAGKLLFEDRAVTNLSRLDLSPLPHGLFLVQATQSNGKSLRAKIAKP